LRRANQLAIQRVDKPAAHELARDDGRKARQGE
jgi:ribosomal protein L15E